MKFQTRLFKKYSFRNLWFWDEKIFLVVRIAVSSKSTLISQDRQDLRENSSCTTTLFSITSTTRPGDLWTRACQFSSSPSYLPLADFSRIIITRFHSDHHDLRSFTRSCIINQRSRHSSTIRSFYSYIPNTTKLWDRSIDRFASRHKARGIIVSRCNKNSLRRSSLLFRDGKR